MKERFRIETVIENGQGALQDNRFEKWRGSTL